MIVSQENPAWIHRLRCGDHAAFGELASRYERLIYACCHSLGLDEDSTEDVMGDTLLVVYEGLPRFQGKSRLSSWVWTIAYRKGVDQLRRQRRYHLNQETASQNEIAAARHSQPEQIVENRECCGRLHQALTQLPATWATALELFYWQAKSTHEIASTMEVTAGVVRAYLFRGRNRLRELMLA